MTNFAGTEDLALRVDSMSTAPSVQKLSNFSQVDGVLESEGFVKNIPNTSKVPRNSRPRGPPKTVCRPSGQKMSGLGFPMTPFLSDGRLMI